MVKIRVKGGIYPGLKSKLRTIPSREREVPHMPDVQTASSQAHREAVVSSIQDVAAYLQEVLGQKLTAHIAGIADSKAVGSWASGERAPRPEAEQKLRAAYQIFRLLLTEESPYTVRAWFLGLNPQLNDESPAAAIREGRAQEAWVAAKAFLAGG